MEQSSIPSTADQDRSNKRRTRLLFVSRLGTLFTRRHKHEFITCPVSQSILFLFSPLERKELRRFSTGCQHTDTPLKFSLASSALMWSISFPSSIYRSSPRSLGNSPPRHFPHRGIWRGDHACRFVKTHQEVPPFGGVLFGRSPLLFFFSRYVWYSTNVSDWIMRRKNGV